MRSVDEKMMSDAKIFLDRHQTKNVSPETIRRYMKTGRQFFGRHRGIQKTGAKATYYLRKAALEFYAAELLMRAGRSGDLKSFRLAFLTLEKLYTPLVGIAAINAGNVCPVQQTQPINSKRKSLQGLPVDWRDRMLVGESGKERDWLLLLSACGLRPSEIARGVDVIPYKNGAVFLIKGAKTSQGYGQKIREIYSESSWAKELAQQGGRTISASKANSVSKYVSRRGQEVFPRKTRKVAAYSYRHQFSADMKASDLTEPEISMLLGHKSLRTKKLYGRSSQARGAVAVQLLHATNPVQSGVKPLFKLSSSSQKSRFSVGIKP